MAGRDVGVMKTVIHILFVCSVPLGSIHTFCCAVQSSLES